MKKKSCQQNNSNDCIAIKLSNKCEHNQNAIKRIALNNEWERTVFRFASHVVELTTHWLQWFCLILFFCWNENEICISRWIRDNLSLAMSLDDSLEWLFSSSSLFYNRMALRTIEIRVKMSQSIDPQVHSVKTIEFKALVLVDNSFPGIRVVSRKFL